MLSVITALEFFQHHFAKMGHRNTSCDPHLHQAIEHPMLPTSREASAAGRLRPNAVIGKVDFRSPLIKANHRTHSAHRGSGTGRKFIHSLRTGKYREGSRG